MDPEIEELADDIRACLEEIARLEEVTSNMPFPSSPEMKTWGQNVLLLEYQRETFAKYIKTLDRLDRQAALIKKYQLQPERQPARTA